MCKSLLLNPASSYICCHCGSVMCQIAQSFHSLVLPGAPGVPSTACRTLWQGHPPAFSLRPPLCGTSPGLQKPQLHIYAWNLGFSQIHLNIPGLTSNSKINAQHQPSPEVFSSFFSFSISVRSSSIPFSVALSAFPSIRVCNTSCYTH